MPLEQLINTLETSGYLLLFPIAVMEGPIVTVLSGFLVSLGIFNLFIAYAIIVVGDILGDAFWYLLGRYGSGWKYTKPIENFFGLTPERIESTRHKFHHHRYKMMMASKLIHGVGSAGLLTAGIVRVPYLTFAVTCLTVTLAQAAFFLALGYFFGEAYEQISQYLDYFAAAGVVLSIAAVAGGLWWALRKRGSNK